jgi:glycosyltransferase involved in cell wall biosynthesis
MAVRDGEPWLDRSLASLSAQTLGGFEIVVVDDGSTDGTWAKLQQWTAREPRLRIARLDRPGLAAALNHAVALARGPFIARLDADDIAEPERLERQVTEMGRRPSLAVLGSAVILIDATGRSIGAFNPAFDDAGLRRDLAGRCCLVQSSVMVRKDQLLAVGGYRPGLNIGEDFDLWARLAEVGELGALERPLVRYRMHRDAVSSQKSVRGALVAVAIAAAQVARRTGQPEPFRGGAPRVRQALRLLGRSRRRLIADIRADLVSARLLRAYLALPAPGWLKARVRQIAIDLGLRPLYRRILTLAAPPS